MRTFPWLSALFLTCAPFASAFDAGDDAFEKRIRPVLAEHCWKCHGATKQASGLRLDSRAAMLAGGSGEGPSVIPGKPDESPLVRAVRQDGDLKMPPKGHIAPEAVRDFADWVQAGAVWPKSAEVASKDDLAKTHWSFQPVRKVQPPTTKRRAGSAIDAFIEAKLETAGLAPQPRADRRTLIRRAAIDLIGLPPSPAEVDAFVNDPRTDADAFAKLVDRLLANPHYGERWGRFWLDVARYADTKGYVFTEETRYPYSYTYRDWVVAALNDDMPYDRFVLAQLAADKLPTESDNHNLAALGFLTVGRRFLQDQNEIIDDRIDLVTRGLLGLSLACARCHDHKFDPLPTADYYSLYGVFASCEEPKELPVLRRRAGTKESADYDRERARIRAASDNYLKTRRAEIEKDLRARFKDYLLAAEKLDFDPGAAKLDEVANAGKLRPETLRALAMRWKRRGDEGEPLLAPWKTLATKPPGEFKAAAEALAAAIKAKKNVDAKVPKPLRDALAAHPPANRAELANLYADLVAKTLAEPKNKAFDTLRHRLDAPDGPLAITAPNAAAGRRGGPRFLSKPERDKLKQFENQLAALEVSHPGAPSRAMVINDRPQPVEPHIFLRGNPGRPGPQVPRRFLKVLSSSDRPAFKVGSGRLELAQAIVRPDNPLAARVMVNRIWMNHFGEGLVRTPSDFGARGDAPTHPELLDWLAATFVERGWSIKAMHRVIMLTDAYQRRSDVTPPLLEKDPRNLLLAHQNRRRLDFEAMRDGLLAASGQLDPTLGGRSFRLDAEPFGTRRTIYGFVDRYNLPPIFRTFDFPTPDTTSPKRASTIVPMQALFLLNNGFVVEQARGLSRRVQGLKSPENRVQTLYRTLFGRDATPSETAAALAFIERRAHSAHDAPTSPWRYGTGRVDESPGGAHVVDFRPFPHWTGTAWQLGPKIPTPDGNFANLLANGGHPGIDGRTSTVLRWTAPADLAVSVDGTLAHNAKEGDGVRSRVVAARAGVLGAWTAHASQAHTRLERVELKAGETLDFVVDCRAECSFDGYAWAPSIQVVGMPPAGLRRNSWDARVDWHGPEAPGLAPWEAYAQALLLTNEFMYVD